MLLLLFLWFFGCGYQEILGSLTQPTLAKYNGNAAAGGQQIDESSLSGSRGWINWLSLGMLGAGGVDNSSQFSGVVSDEIVKVFQLLMFIFYHLSLL